MAPGAPDRIKNLANAKPWQADVEYAPELVRSLVERETDIKIRKLDFLGEGWDNVAFLVNDELVFRFVRREAGLSFARNEAAGLPHLPEFPLRVPRVHHRGVHQNKWPWMAYPLLPGVPAHEADLSDAQRIQAAPAIARFLKILHAQDPAPYRAAGLEGDSHGHMNLRKRVPQAREKLRALTERNLFPVPGEFHALVDLVESYPQAEDTHVIHGDFKAAHILFANGVATSVIDWGDIHIGHRATDLAIAYSLFPPAGREIFRREYGEGQDSALWTLARFRALYHCAIILEYAVDSGQRLLRQEAHRALTWITDVDSLASAPPLSPPK